MDPAIEAIRQAKKSYMTQRHGAVIVRNGVIIAKGYNRHLEHLNHLFSLHAEMDAIGDLKKKFSAECKSKKWIKDCRLYVVRLASDNSNLKNSHPCENCQNAITQVGIPITFYSTCKNINIDDIV